MTLANIFSQMGASPKQLTDRYSPEYPAPAHEQHVYYPYEPEPSHVHVSSSKHHYKGGDSHKSNAALSALTLLAFLFFLHILQQCLRDHMTAMSTPQVMIMTSSRENEESIGKTPNDKLDKSGLTENAKRNSVSNTKDNKNNESTESPSAGSDKYLTKLSISEYTPKTGADKYKQILDIYSNQSPKAALAEQGTNYGRK